jgi:hypothetical protein
MPVQVVAGLVVGRCRTGNGVTASDLHVTNAGVESGGDEAVAQEWGEIRLVIPARRAIRRTIRVAP